MDIGKILQDWAYDPLTINTRIISGDNGRQKLQMRVDLGLLQMELEGRPDGLRPEGFDSYLDLFRHQAAEKTDFLLTPRQSFDLRQEGIQYYHRYICLHQLKDYKGVIRDTRHNLDILNFFMNHADAAENLAIQQHRPYMTMMNTSAKVMLKMDEDDKTEALHILKAGMRQIKHIYESLLDDPQPDLSPEMMQLKELQHRITDDGIPTELPATEKLEIELQVALLSENYEKAARLRDQIARTSEKLS